METTEHLLSSPIAVLVHGSGTFIHCFTSLLNVNVHTHSLVNVCNRNSISKSRHWQKDLLKVKGTIWQKISLNAENTVDSCKAHMTPPYSVMNFSTSTHNLGCTSQKAAPSHFYSASFTSGEGVGLNEGAWVYRNSTRNSASNTWVTHKVCILVLLSDIFILNTNNSCEIKFSMLEFHT